MIKPGVVEAAAGSDVTQEEFTELARRLAETEAKLKVAQAAQDDLQAAHDSLQDTQARLVSETKNLKIEAAIKDTELSKLKGELQEKRRIIDWFRRQLYGPSSERRSWEVLDCELQLWLEGMGLELPETPPPSNVSVKQHERQRRAKPTFVDDHSQLKFSEEATVIDIEVPNPEIEGIPEDQLEVVAEKTVYRLAQLSSPFVVVRFVRKVVKQTETGELLVAPTPSSVIPRSSFDVSFLAGMIVSKFLLHLPLYRQHQWLEQAGVFVDRGNLTRVMHRLGELLEPIYEALQSSVLQSSTLAVDETPTPVGRGGGKTGQGYFWVFYGDLHELFFLFSPSRGGEVLDKTLEGFAGKLLCDGHSAYESFSDRVKECTLCQCWSHARREFLEAEKMEPGRTKWVLDQMRLLYAIEKRAKEKSSPERLELRQNESRPIVERILKYLDEVVQTAAMLPSNPFLKAAKYVTNRRVELQVFLSDPDVSIDTNHVERELRPQAVGRKNWLFHMSEVGARCGAIFYSLIRSCAVADVDPTVYLIDVLQRIDSHPSAKTYQLIPRLWKKHFAGEPLRSVSHQLLAKPPP